LDKDFENEMQNDVFNILPKKVPLEIFPDHRHYEDEMQGG
jgi:hypothetical protein